MGENQIVGKIQELQSKAGKTYYKVELGDKIYTINKIKRGDKTPQFVLNEFLVALTDEKPWRSDNSQDKHKRKYDPKGYEVNDDDIPF